MFTGGGKGKGSGLNGWYEMTKAIALTGYFNIAGRTSEQSVMIAGLYDVLTFALSERLEQLDKEKQIEIQKRLRKK